LDAKEVQGEALKAALKAPSPRRRTRRGGGKWGGGIPSLAD